MNKKYIALGICIFLEVFLIILMCLYFHTKIFKNNFDAETTNQVSEIERNFPEKFDTLRAISIEEARQIPALYNFSIDVLKNSACGKNSFEIKIYSNDDFAAEKVDLDSFQFLIENHNFADLNNDGVDDLLVCTKKDLSKEVLIVFNAYEGKGNIFGKVNFKN